MDILECSSRGDTRFSALFARVIFLGKDDTIENHYQNAKGFVSGYSGRKKGKRPDFVLISGIQYELKYLTPWYDLLWVKYLQFNPDLVKVLEKYNDYNDCFKTKNMRNCQADTIRRYMKDRENLLKEVDVLYQMILKDTRDCKK